MQKYHDKINIISIYSTWVWPF